MQEKLATNKIRNSTQKYMDVAEVRDDVIVMRDGTLRAVLLVASVNFALKSEEEQNAMVAAYVSFLNNIDYPLQIVIQSRELNIDNYINNLKKRQKEQINELLKIQTADYLQYIEELVAMGKIMSKRFYVIIPYNPISDKQKNFFTRLGEVLKAATVISLEDKVFKRRKEQLDRRIGNIMSGLGSMSINSVQLDTQSIIELLYNTYNPKTSDHQKLADIKELRIST
jgi:hypothetical protein